MSGANKLFLTLAVSLALTAAAAAAEQGVTADTIAIGAFGPITGPAAYIGLAGRDGAAMAIKEINAAGGINGRKLNMTFEDDGHSPAKALAAVKKLIDDDKVFALFCVAGSNGTIGTIDYVKEKGLVMFVSFASAPGVTWPFAKNLFRGGTTEVPRYGELYAEYIVDGLKAQKIAIISGREEYPKNEGDALTKQLQKWYSITPVKRVEFNIGDKDFTPQLLEMQQANPQVIAFFGNPAEAAIALAAGKGARPQPAVFCRHHHGRSGAVDRRRTRRRRRDRLCADSTAARFKRPGDECVARQMERGISEPAPQPAQHLRRARLCRHVRAGRSESGTPART